MSHTGAWRPVFLVVVLLVAFATVRGAARVATVSGTVTDGSTGLPIANAKLYLYDRDLGAGVVVRAAADGSYVAPPIEAKLGDRIDLDYEKPSGERSPGVCRVLELLRAELDTALALCGCTSPADVSPDLVRRAALGNNESPNLRGGR